MFTSVNSHVNMQQLELALSNWLYEYYGHSEEQTLISCNIF